MKYCPACNFTFPNFHRVCDFDGTELVSDEPQSLIKVPKRLPRRGLKSSMLLTTGAVLGLFVGAVLIGHFQSPTPSIPAVVKDQGSQNLQAVAAQTEALNEGSENVQVVGARADGVNEEKATASKRKARPLANRTQNKLTASSTVSPQPSAKRNQNKLTTSSSGNPQRRNVVDRPSRTTTARNREAARTSSEKSPKIAAILKTTWKFLKKPFDF